MTGPFGEFLWPAPVLDRRPGAPCPLGSRGTRVVRRACRRRAGNRGEKHRAFPGGRRHGAYKFIGAAARGSGHRNSGLLTLQPGCRLEYPPDIEGRARTQVGDHFGRLSLFVGHPQRSLAAFALEELLRDEGAAAERRPCTRVCVAGAGRVCAR